MWDIIKARAGYTVYKALRKLEDKLEEDDD